jgi:uncharacterized RDD family membrane protein YckC
MYTIIGGDGKEYGPVPADQVRSWLTAGRANLDTQVKVFGTNEWKRLRDFPEFGENAAEAPPVMPGQGVDSPVAEGQLAGRWVRLGAQLLDGVVTAVLIGPGVAMLLPWIIAQGNADPSQSLFSRTPFTLSSLTDQVSLSTLPVAGATVLVTGWLVLTVIQIILLSLRGQSIGKIVAGVRIVRLDGQPAGFVHAWLLRNFVVRIICAVPTVGPIFWLTDILFIFSEGRRCVHDRIAGTRVVKAG